MLYLILHFVLEDWRHEFAGERWLPSPRLVNYIHAGSECFSDVSADSLERQWRWLAQREGGERDDVNVVPDGNSGGGEAC